MGGSLDPANFEGLLVVMRRRLADHGWDAAPQFEAELTDRALRAGRRADRDGLRALIRDAVETLDDPERTAVRVMVGLDPQFRSTRLIRKTIVEEMGKILDTRTEPLGTPGLGRRQVEKLEREVLVPLVAERMERILSAAVSTEPGGPLVPPPQESTPPSPIRPTVSRSPQGLRIIESIRRIIAQHGLDDETWASAISAQYFLVLLARRLEMIDQQDYEQLMDRFLGSFTYRVSDKVVLNPDRVLVTPEELKKISECMEEEDAEDTFFTKTTKTKAANVNTELLHLNYLYGLTLAIAASPPRTRILRALEDAAIDHLILEKGMRTLDEYGGWSPYRIPWVTARVLISLSHVDIAVRPETQFILRVVDTGLRSLVYRQVDGKYWRSGVGTWVSKWEATGLCLEALLRWEHRLDDKTAITGTLEYLRTDGSWLRQPPRFDSGDAANETLASVVIASLLVGRESSGVNERDEPFLDYVESALKVLLNSDASPRQFCTVPQVAYYAAEAALR